ncbi:hypothetical protein B0T14DRAFT_570329 [Immersiella caudata]|uniref:Heterokaryon incompatibility domain-containing protein n=1 Tax=Immersiella caudata TaxID=314043 RepID=A0AA40BUT6_9PEZI|nr:hypothetical protein B0T14DRAFT_570329 [Immersiella caudata]
MTCTRKTGRFASCLTSISGLVPSWSSWEARGAENQVGQFNEQAAMMLLVPKLLSEDGYWQRLWVIQEIGNAARIRVYYQTCRSDSQIPAAKNLFQHQDFELDWEEFIEMVRSTEAQLRDRLWESRTSENDTEDTGPLRLDK